MLTLGRHINKQNVSSGPIVPRVSLQSDGQPEQVRVMARRGPRPPSAGTLALAAGIQTLDRHIAPRALEVQTSAMSVFRQLATPA